MREPIKPEDIREGDLIRWEDGETAHEFRRGKHGTIARHGQHYLLDRPRLAVDLPAGPTLGWLHVTDTGQPAHRGPGRILSIFRTMKHSVDGGNVGSWSHEYVTAFTPAVAVPAEALETLRAEHGDDQPGACMDVIAFLAAVDNANEQATR